MRPWSGAHLIVGYVFWRIWEIFSDLPEAINDLERAEKMNVEHRTSNVQRRMKNKYSISNIQRYTLNEF